MQYKLWVTFRLRSKGNVPNTNNILCRCRFISYSLIGQAFVLWCPTNYFWTSPSVWLMPFPWGRRYSVPVLLQRLRMESCRSTALKLAVCLPFRTAFRPYMHAHNRWKRTETRVSKFGAHDGLVAPWRELWFAEDHGRAVSLNWKHGLAISKCLLISITLYVVNTPCCCHVCISLQLLSSVSRHTKTQTGICIKQWCMQYGV